MPTDSVKLTYSFLRRLFLCALYTAPILIISDTKTLNVYKWIMLIFFAILAINYWSRLFWPETIVEISKKGIWCQEERKRRIGWEEILWFKTIIVPKPKGGQATYLVLKPRRGFLNIDVNLTSMRTNEVQIREWIKKYAGAACPGDQGHTIISYK